ncbi:MAG: CDP-glycerol glycerophosphotransferase family protein [Clostridia bacterium]|nr:CDP-glycerol glycerophosphotransferase family protein [Clostridia bacterium]
MKINELTKDNAKAAEAISPEDAFEKDEAGPVATDKEDYKYQFSIVMPVYNVEEYIDEAVESIFQQTIGFEKNVQLILVDDGSPDNCAQICDGYRERYPDNVVVIHKKNGGLASARNAGLAIAEGRYVNFADPDDKFSLNALSKVYDFFRKYDHIIDVACIPVHQFGDVNSPHHLNDKFKNGTRIINLEREYQYILMFANSSFVKNCVAKREVFRSDLVVAEDAEQMTKLLMDNHFLGVVSGCKYLYRRRGNSLVGAGTQKKGWYTQYLINFTKNTLDYAEAKFGYIPRFVQNVVMCDLQWRLRIEEEPEVLSPEERAEYKELLNACIKRIDNEIIMRQRHLPFDAKLYYIAKKYEPTQFISRSFNNIYYGRDGDIHHYFSQNRYELQFLEVDDTAIHLSVRQSVLAFDTAIDSMFIKVNKVRYDAEKMERIKNRFSVGEPISYYYVADFHIPIADLKKSNNRISFHTSSGNSTITNVKLVPCNFFPMSTKYKNGFYAVNNLLFKLGRSEISVSAATDREIAKHEKKFCKELWKSNRLGERKAVVARALARLYRKFHKKPIWIISDRLNKAGDNGEAFFRYLREIDYKGADYYYTIGKCASYDQMKPLGRVVDHSSLKYKVLHLAADCIISAQADYYVTNPFSGYSEPYRDILANKKFVFLQHGITQNDISSWLNRYNKNIQGFICAAVPEHDSIVNGNYFYTDEKVWLTGFARFDRLYRDEKKYITLMPTWRRYLMTENDRLTGIWAAGSQFAESEYFRYYNSLINDKRLIDAAEKYGYTICYMPHPNTITKIDLFDHDERVKFFSINDEYRDVYAQSSLVLTDYSSAAFDFAYLRKPIVYTQFDKEDFFGGAHVCVQGYFDYERDGFGEVTYDLDTTVETLIDYMKNDCKLKDQYRERIDSFFAFNDQNNCKRILDKILEMK